MNDGAGEAHDVKTALEKKTSPVASALSELVSARNNGSVYRYIEATSGDGQKFKMREWGRGATRLGIALISLLIIFILSLVRPDLLRLVDGIKLPFYGR
jgi:hypothetical protein